jgi:hypothetical protein
MLGIGVRTVLAPKSTLLYSPSSISRAIFRRGCEPNVSVMSQSSTLTVSGWPGADGSMTGGLSGAANLHVAMTPPIAESRARRREFYDIERDVARLHGMLEELHRTA